MNERPRYSMAIQWSDEDEAYIVSLPEWEAHGLIGHTWRYLRPSRKDWPAHADLERAIGKVIRCRNPSRSTAQARQVSRRDAAVEGGVHAGHLLGYALPYLL